MKFPLKPTEGFFGLKSQVPGNGQCLICSKRIGEAHGFIRFTAGALLYDSKKKDSGGPSRMMESILSLWYHGPHPSKTNKDGTIELTSMDNSEFSLDLVEKSEGGQVDISFCSSDCLQNFFDEVVKALRLGVEQADSEFEKRQAEDV